MIEQQRRRATWTRAAHRASTHCRAGRALRQLRGRRRREWFAYIGSFGDDFFSED